MADLGRLYYDRLGGPQDYATARQWFEKAAAAGDNYGMNNTGRSFEAGWNGPSDYSKAREWYEKAATAGNHCQGQLGQAVR